MGGGISTLFYGTKGAEKEYQYTFFNDEKTNNEKQKMSDLGLTIGGSISISSKNMRKRIISVEMVLKKCQAYRDGILTSRLLIQWLNRITDDSVYILQDDLRYSVKNALNDFSKSLIDAENNNIERFNTVLQGFEKKLRQLL